MVNSIPIVIIVIAVVLVVVALLVWRMQKEGKLERINNKKKKKKKAFFAQFITGIVVALLAAIFMFDGDILGENTAGISTAIGIVGICLIATSNIYLLPKRK